MDMFAASNKTLRSPPADEVNRTLHQPRQQNCYECNQPDKDPMVQCDECDSWHHFDCVGVTSDIENKPWKCSLCTGTRKKTGSTNVGGTDVPKEMQVPHVLPVSTQPDLRSSHKDVVPHLVHKKANDVLNTLDNKHSRITLSSKASSTTSSVRRKRIELERLEAENKLAQDLLEEESRLMKKRVQIQQEFITKKYDLLDQIAESEESDAPSEILDDQQERVDEWVTEQVNEGSRNDLLAPQLNSTTRRQTRSTYPLRPPTKDGQTSNRNDQLPPAHQQRLHSPVHDIVRTPEPVITIDQQLREDQLSHSAQPFYPAQPISHDILQESTRPTLDPKRCSFQPTTTHPVSSATIKTQPGNIAQPTNSNVPSQTPLMPSFHPDPSNSGLHQNETAHVQTHLSHSTEGIFDSSQFVARQVIKTELPTFNGNPEDWMRFYCAYESSSKSCGLTDAENMSRLQHSLKGKAYEAVKCLLLVPATVPEAIDTLKALFGSPDIVANTMLMQLRNLVAPKSAKFESMIDFSVAVKNTCSLMMATAQPELLRNRTILQDLVEKLPEQIYVNWAIYANTIPSVDLMVFSTWLFQFALALRKVSMPKIDPKKFSEKTTRTSKDKNFVNTHIKTSEESAVVSKKESPPKSKIRPCVVCSKSDHRVDKCPEFLSMDVASRWNKIRQLRLCRKCLGVHFFRHCHVFIKCGINGCEGFHHQLIHRDYAPISTTTATTSTTKPTTTSSVSGAECNAHQESNQAVFFRIIPIKLFGRNHRMIETYAYLDDGSSLTLIEEELANALELDGESQDLCLKWTKDTVRMEMNSKRVSMQVSSMDNEDRKFVIHNARTVERLGLPVQTVTNEDLAKYEHIRDLPIQQYTNAIPRILIGLDNSKLVSSLKTRDGGWNEPVASKTRLGWTFFGCNGSRDEVNSLQVHLAICDCTRDDEIYRLVKTHFELDSLGVKQPQNLPESIRERRERMIMETTTSRIDGRYETGLLWKHDSPNLPDSYPMAFRRLICLEKKMEREPDLKIKINQLILEYVEKKYAKKLTVEDLQPETARVWYLPIFTVTNPNKPNKFRVVWDAAARADGVSLNSNLSSGPDQLSSLLGILYRFREGRVAICGDIREMFHQIRIIAQDQPAQRFLWRDPKTNKVETYQMEVMTFGATCSPSSAQYIKNKNASEFLSQHPRAVDSILRNHYVDDLLDSVDSTEEAVNLARTIKMIHEHGGFEMRAWLSNEKSVVQSLQASPTDSADNLNIDPDNEIDKVLGMWWRTTKDTFSYSLKYNKLKDVLYEEKRPTKRQVLKIVMSIFDPLGLLSLYTIYAKIVMRDTWRSSIDWDEQLPDELFARWIVWIRLLPTIETISIPRCYYGQTASADITSRQLHVFVDASEDAYAAVAFIRVETNVGQTSCSIIAAKARVVPQKPITIPRAELQAALIGARLAKTITDEHRHAFDKKVMWSDSRTVLSWLKGDCRQYKPYVAFRVAEILDLTDENDWRWVPTKTNIADDATKWVNNQPNLEASGRWFKGPEFIYKSESYWPENPMLESTEEEKRSHHVHATREVDESIDVNRFSNWSRMLRTYAYVFRFVMNLKRKCKGIDLVKNELQQDELQAAENALFRKAQCDSYSDEVDILRKSKNGQVRKSSVLYRHSPYLDTQNVLRMRGRIDAAPGVTYDVKRPILLPKDHQITRLLVKSYHHRLHHLNHETVINEMRQKFVIPTLRALLKSVRRNCPVCIMMAAKPINPEMADLPNCRLKPFVRPFSYVGVDYFGPMNVIVGRRVEKRYGVLFTCLNIRAVHLEVAHSLSTDSCILAIRNFIARRGNPIEFVSDNGTNFHGTNNELQSQWSKLNKKHIHECFTSTTTKWSFNPPAAPHMGGVWERLVRSVKTILMQCLPSRKPSDELLRSYLNEVEHIINSRPLTYMSLDSVDEEALTPNHFLLGSSSGDKIPGEFGVADLASRKQWRISQQLANMFWNRWVKEYLPNLTKRTKWFEKTSPINVGDVVIVVDPAFPRNSWPKGIITETTAGSNGQVRRAIVRTASGTYSRPVSKLAKLDIK